MVEELQFLQRSSLAPDKNPSRCDSSNRYSTSDADEQCNFEESDVIGLRPPDRSFDYVRCDRHRRTSQLALQAIFLLVREAAALAVDAEDKVIGQMKRLELSVIAAHA
jgi:hypothetical protein